MGPGPGQSTCPRKASSLVLMAHRGSSSLLAVSKCPPRVVLVCLFSQCQIAEEATQEPANVTKHTHVHTTARFTISPSPQSSLYKRTAAAQHTTASTGPSKGNLHPAAILRSPLFLWWGMKELPTQPGCATLGMQPRSFPLSVGLSRKSNAAALQSTNQGPATTCIPLSGPACCTSRESFVCMGQAVTAQCTKQAPCANRVAGEGPSITASAGWHLQGELAAGHCFCACSWRRVRAK